MKVFLTGGPRSSSSTSLFFFLCPSPTPAGPLHPVCGPSPRSCSSGAWPWKLIASFVCQANLHYLILPFWKIYRTRQRLLPSSCRVNSFRLPKIHTCLYICSVISTAFARDQDPGPFALHQDHKVMSIRGIGRIAL